MTCQPLLSVPVANVSLLEVDGGVGIYLLQQRSRILRHLRGDVFDFGFRCQW
jgi:hypothetical protein